MNVGMYDVSSMEHLQGRADVVLEPYDLHGAKCLLRDRPEPGHQRASPTRGEDRGEDREGRYSS